jgi:hypothetical protein
MAIQLIKTICQHIHLLKVNRFFSQLNDTKVCIILQTNISQLASPRPKQ